MPHIRGEEAEEGDLLPHPGQCARTAVSERGCEHNDVAMLTHHGLRPQDIVVPKVTTSIMQRCMGSAPLVGSVAGN